VGRGHGGASTNVGRRDRFILLFACHKKTPQQEARIPLLDGLLARLLRRFVALLVRIPFKGLD